jgi:hypothetical protein
MMLKMIVASSTSSVVAWVGRVRLAAQLEVFARGRIDGIRNAGLLDCSPCTPKNLMAAQLHKAVYVS